MPEKMKTLYALRSNYTHCCPTCEAPTVCDLEAGKSVCWCFQIEGNVTPDDTDPRRCLCRGCLSGQTVPGPSVTPEQPS